MPSAVRMPAPAYKGGPPSESERPASKEERTVSTGTADHRTSDSAMEPSASRLPPERPCVPMTMEIEALVACDVGDHRRRGALDGSYRRVRTVQPTARRLEATLHIHEDVGDRAWFVQERALEDRVEGEAVGVQQRELGAEEPRQNRSRSVAAHPRLRRNRSAPGSCGSAWHPPFNAAQRTPMHLEQEPSHHASMQTRPTAARACLRRATGLLK